MQSSARFGSFTALGPFLLSFIFVIHFHYVISKLISISLSTPAMLVLFQPQAICAGLVQAKLPFRNPKYSTHNKLSDFNDVKVVQSRWILGDCIRKSSELGFGSKYAIQSGRDVYYSNSNHESPQLPFPLPLIREAIWSIRSLFIFLVEQPSQLKYVEWPGFASTLKTATLTLVLVALLIVALSSIDSALSFLLAFILRRQA